MDTTEREESYEKIETTDLFVADKFPHSATCIRDTCCGNAGYFSFGSVIR